MHIIDYDDYKKVLAKYGYNENDFKLKRLDKSEQTPTGPLGIGEYNQRIDLEVKRIKTNKTKTYAMIMTGTHSWTIDFEKDLNDGYFNF